jgi:hypothetical protein
MFQLKAGIVVFMRTSNLKIGKGFFFILQQNEIFYYIKSLSVGIKD